MYTEKKGVAMLRANTHDELKINKLRKFAFRNGFLNSLKIFSFAWNDCGSGVFQDNGFLQNQE